MWESCYFRQTTSLKNTLAATPYFGCWLAIVLNSLSQLGRPYKVFCFKPVITSFSSSWCTAKWLAWKEGHEFRKKKKKTCCKKHTDIFMYLTNCTFTIWGQGTMLKSRRLKKKDEQIRSPHTIYNPEGSCWSINMNKSICSVGYDECHGRSTNISTRAKKVGEVEGHWESFRVATFESGFEMWVGFKCSDSLVFLSAVHLLCSMTLSPHHNIPPLPLLWKNH